MKGEDHTILVEYTTMFTKTTGVVLRGELDDDDNLRVEYYYPFCNGKKISTTKEAQFEEMVDKSAYSVLCDDERFVVCLVFFLQNNMQYRKWLEKDGPMKPCKPSYLAGLSLNGKILLPTKKSKRDRKRAEDASTTSRQKLMEAVRNGDEMAIEDWSMKEYDTYCLISERIHKHDLFSLVDTYFMPNGLESYEYSLLGEIMELSVEKNWFTKETVYVMHLDCYTMAVTVCINEEDLFGEPMVGRRFRGTVWMQGRVVLPD